MGRVRIGAQDQLAGKHDRLLAEDLVADAATHLEKVADSLLGHKLADLGVVLRMLCGRRRHGMVERDRQPVGDEHALLAKLLPDAADGGGVVVTQHHVRPRIHDLAYLHVIEPGGACQCLLGKGLGPGSGTAVLKSWCHRIFS